MLVNVSALGTTMDGSTEPYDEIEYSWDFGDETGETITDPRTGQSTDLNNTQRGPEAAYVYRRAGTYMITLTAKAWNGYDYVTATTTTTITVAKWAGDTRYIDAANGLDTNDGKDPHGFALSGATYTASNRTITKTGAFTTYAYDVTADDATYEGEASSLNWIAITSGTGFTVGLYLIASKTSDDAIVLAADARLPGADAANVASSNGPWQTIDKANGAYWLNGGVASNHRRLLLRAGQVYSQTNANGLQTDSTQIRAGRYGSGDNPIVTGGSGAGNRIFVRGTGNHFSHLTADVGSGACSYGLGIANTVLNSFIDQCSTTGTCAAGGSGAWVNADGATSTGVAYWRCSLQANGKHGIYFYMVETNGGYGAVVGCSFGGNGTNIILDHHIYANDLNHFLASLNDFGSTTLRNFCINGNCANTLGEKTRYWCYDRNNFYGTQNGTDFSNSTNDPVNGGHFRNIVILRNAYHTGQIGDQYLGLTPWCAERIAFRENNFYGPIKTLISQQANTADLDLIFERNRIYLAAGALLSQSSNSIVGITLTGNIVVNTSTGTSTSSRLLILPTTHDKIILAGNQYYAPNMAAKAWRNSTSNTDMDFNGWVTFGPESDAIYADPGWIDPANGDFSDSAGSSSSSSPSSISSISDTSSSSSSSLSSSSSSSSRSSNSSSSSSSRSSNSSSASSISSNSSSSSSSSSPSSRSSNSSSSSSSSSNSSSSESSSSTSSVSSYSSSSSSTVGSSQSSSSSSTAAQVYAPQYDEYAAIEAQVARKYINRSLGTQYNEDIDWTVVYKETISRRRTQEELWEE